MGIDPDLRAQIREAARGFEAGFLREMLEAMQKAQLEEGLLGGSAAGKTRAATFNMMLSELLADGEPLGLAELVEEELVRNIEEGRGESPASLPSKLFDFLRWEAKEAPESADEFGG